MIRRRHLLAAAASPGRARHRRACQRAVRLRLEAVQGPEDRGELPAIAARRRAPRRTMKEFEELTGIKVGFEQIPEQQQRPKVAMEMATGHPSFDVVNVGMHVQKRLIERANWMEDLRPVSSPMRSLTAPDFDQADFSKPSMAVATGPDGKLQRAAAQPGPVHPVLEQGAVRRRRASTRRRRRWTR